MRFSAFFFTIFASQVASRSVPAGNLHLSRRGEPKTGNDLPDTKTHPSRLDKVETAFNDAIELSSYVLNTIDNDNDIFPHYFDPADRAEVKRIFQVINNGDKGADFLDKVDVQVTDKDKKCGGGTLAYSADVETDKPFIVLCTPAFKKKAVTALKGKKATAKDAKNFYQSCKKDGGEVDEHVSYVMNTLGMTLLHEYMHLDKMINSKWGSIVDDPNGHDGYGPVNVYDKLDKKDARINADSYAYYASQVLWTTLCQPQGGFKAPRAGIDDDDPDCGGKACKP